MPENRNEGRMIHVVGVEPEGPDPATLPLSRILKHCQLLCGGKRHLEKISPHVPVGAVVLPISNNISELLTVLEEFVRNRDGEGTAVVLATGDPLYYGIGRPISGRIPREFVIYTPATTLIQRAFSLLGDPWEDVRVGSIHSRKEIPIVLSEGRWAFYTDGSNGPHSLVDMADRQGFEVDKMIVLEEIGLPGQRVGVFTSVTASTEYPYKFKSLNIVVMDLFRRSG
ncbi:MAG: precorrin-6y C5,15-methyltransferase (decarboxylating) subunit CbiE [Nitrospirota bacterium]|nr:precorrin-6y C5,15-methyltransferase (decarboxylating) subunit CbiE [Nitrospirota bacterium]